LGEFLAISFRNNTFILFFTFVGFSDLVFSFFLFRFIILTFQPLPPLTFSPFLPSISTFAAQYSSSPINSPSTSFVIPQVLVIFS